MQFAISLERCIGTDVFVKTPRRDRHRNGAATPSSTRISAYFFDPPLLFTIHTPRNQIQASSCLSESCPKIGDVPKSPVPPPAALVPSAGTIALRINLRQCVCHEHPPLLYLRVLLAARVALIERQQAPSLTRLLQGIALGAAATMVIGFYWGGWTLNSTARQMAENRADIAVVAVLAPICVEQFQHQEDAAAKLADFKKIISWNQASYVAAHGWATMPGAGKPKTLAVARACAEMIGQYSPK